MQPLIKYFREKNPNVNVLTVDDAANFLRQLSMTFAIGFEESARNQNDDFDKKETAKDIEYMNTFIQMVVHAFMCGKPRTLLNDGAIVNKMELEGVIDLVSQQLPKIHELNHQTQRLSRDIQEGISIMGDAMYILNHQLNDE